MGLNFKMTFICNQSSFVTVVLFTVGVCVFVCCLSDLRLA